MKSNKTAVLVLAIIGSVLALSVGACSGVCMSGLEKAANGADSGTGGGLLLLGLIESILGIVVALKATKKMEVGEELNKFEKFGLLGAGALSISNTFTFLTAGVCHFIAGAMVAMYKPQAVKVESSNSSDGE